MASTALSRDGPLISEAGRQRSSGRRESRRSVHEVMPAWPGSCADFCQIAGRSEKYYCVDAGGARKSAGLHGEVIALENRKLDAIDLRILAELQADGRITNVELSRRAKITAPPCLRRMRALEKAGFIQGYHADLDGKALGFPGHRLCLCRAWPARRTPTSSISRNGCGAGRKCASATCCRARWISSSNAWRRICRLPEFHHRDADGGEECRQREKFAGDPCRPKSSPAFRSKFLNRKGARAV